MDLKRLCATYAFLWLLTAFLILTQVFFNMWLFGVDQLTLHADYFSERGVEMVLLTIAYFCTPVLLYELDELYLGGDSQ